MQLWYRCGRRASACVSTEPKNKVHHAEQHISPSKNPLMGKLKLLWGTRCQAPPIIAEIENRGQEEG